MRAAALAAVFFLCSCSQKWYHPPEQRPPLESLNTPIWKTIIDADDPDAQGHFVKDIGPATGASWRWTGKRPTMKILLPTADHRLFVVDFTIWDIGFRQTGPVQISFFVNGRLLDRVRYDTPGYKHFEKPVPANWLSTDVETTAAAEIDKLYTAEEDKAQFGFILSRMGFQAR